MRCKNIIALLLTGLLLWGAMGISLPAGAEERKSAGDEYLSKGEAIMLLSATDFMKRKIGELLSWTVGYDISKVNRVRLTPTIGYIKAAPKKVPPDGRTVLEILAAVDDPAGLANIAGVRADLSSIGRLPNTMLVDNGLFGDEKAGDGIYTLQTSVSPKVPQGSKDIPVAAVNKKGWLALAKTSLEVKKNPVILWAKFTPEKALANGTTLVTIAVRVDNPGRIEDVAKVSADLRDLGLYEETMLRNDGEAGDAFAGDDIWSLQFTLAKGTPLGPYAIPVSVNNLSGGEAEGEAGITVIR